MPLLPELGDRVRLRTNESEMGVVCYCGEIPGTSVGVWIGVDWDNPKRGKHNGSLHGIQYFTARTETSGSFVRPEALILGNDLIAEVSSKYANDKISFATNDGRWEFVQLNRIYDKQKNIFDLKCIVLINTNVSHISASSTRFDKCIELDLTGTLIAKWTNLFEILSYFPNLKTLHLNNTRMESLSSEKILSVFTKVLQISLQNAFLSTETANLIVKVFPNLAEIYLACNALDSYSPPLESSENLKQVDLQQNEIPSISRIIRLSYLPRLEHLNLSQCGLQNIRFDADNEEKIFPSLKVLNIENNPICEWSSIDELARLPKLEKLNAKALRLAGVPGLQSRELIIAKLTKLIELDHCDVSEVERRSIELYVLKCLSSLDAMDPSHLRTKQRLERVYDVIFERNENLAESNSFLSNSRKIFLKFEDRQVQRVLSTSLSIHRVVCVAAKLLRFDPDEIVAVALERKGLSAERICRTRDDLLSRFNLDDNDRIVFLRRDRCSSGDKCFP